MSNDDLYKNVLSSISELFGDTSVSQSKCKENLKSLIEEIEIMIDGLSNEVEE